MIYFRYKLQITCKSECEYKKTLGRTGFQSINWSQENKHNGSFGHSWSHREDLSNKVEQLKGIQPKDQIKKFSWFIGLDYIRTGRPKRSITYTV